MRRRAGSQQFLGHGRHGADHVLAGLEHQQQRSDGKQSRHVLPRGGPAGIRTDGHGDRGRNQAGIGH